MSTANKKWWQRRQQRRTINWKDGGHQQETFATRDINKSRQRQRIGDNNCGGLQRPLRTAMAMDDDSVERERHMRAGGGRRWGKNETGWRTKTAFGIY